MKRIFQRLSNRHLQSLPNPYWRRYDISFCNGPVELQSALQRINTEGHVIVSITQYLSEYTVVFKRFD